MGTVHILAGNQPKSFIPCSILSNPVRCPSVSGQSEWEQFKYWLATTLNHSLDNALHSLLETWSVQGRPPASKLPNNHKGYKHHVTSLSNHTEGHVIIQQFLIKETIHGIPSNGGSNFRVNITSGRHIQVCHVQDDFTGTYQICCRINSLLTGSMYNINITLLFSGFSAFSMSPSNPRHIWWKEFIGSEVKDWNPLPVCKSVAAVNLLDGVWIRPEPGTSTYNRYVVNESGQDCIYPLMKNNMLRKCFQKDFKNEMVMMGDSHIRYAYQTIIKYLTSKSRYHQVHHDIKIQKYQFKWRNTCKLLAVELKRYLVNRQMKKDQRQHLLILSATTWDMKDTPSPELLRCLTYKVAPLLKSICQLPRTVVEWQTVPSVPDIHPIDDMAVPNIRNSFIISAVNYYISSLLSPLGVAVIPASFISLPWSENLGSMRSHLMDVVHGKEVILPPGHVVTYALLYQACKHYSSHV